MTIAWVAGVFVVQLIILGTLVAVTAEARAHARDLERLIEIVEEVVFEDEDVEREEVGP